MGTLRILEILRDLSPTPKFLHASSREIFGTPTQSPQDESTPVNPNSPYGAAKAFANQLVKIYRESHGLFFCNATQSRKLRYAKNKPRCRKNKTRPPKRTAPGKHRYPPRLGFRRRIRRSHVAHSSTTLSERLYTRHRPITQRPRLHPIRLPTRGVELERLLPTRSPIPSPHRTTKSPRERFARRTRTRMETPNFPPTTRRTDGRSRPRFAQKSLTQLSVFLLRYSPQAPPRNLPPRPIDQAPLTAPATPAR